MRDYVFTRKEMLALGATSHIANKPEVLALQNILHADEKIKAFIYGAYPSGFGMMFATDKRLLFVDKRTFDLDVDEIPYSMIATVHYDRGRILDKVTIHSRAKNYFFARVRRLYAKPFVRYVEERMLKAQNSTKEFA